MLLNLKCQTISQFGEFIFQFHFPSIRSTRFGPLDSLPCRLLDSLRFGPLDSVHRTPFIVASWISFDSVHLIWSTGLASLSPLGFASIRSTGLASLSPLGFAHVADSHLGFSYLICIFHYLFLLQLVSLKIINHDTSIRLYQRNFPSSFLVGARIMIRSHLSFPATVRQRGCTIFSAFQK